MQNIQLSSNEFLGLEISSHSKPAPLNINAMYANVPTKVLPTLNEQVLRHKAIKENAGKHIKTT
jgi:hypothetical protein